MKNIQVRLGRQLYPVHVDKASLTITQQYNSGRSRPRCSSFGMEMDLT